MRSWRKAARNGTVKKLATLWKLVDEMKHDEKCGRIQVHRGDEGRIIRMVGLREVGKEWGVIPTLICDATGDFELLKAIWPHLWIEDEKHDWQQLPRPKSLRIFQIVNRSISKWAIAVEGTRRRRSAKSKALVACMQRC